MKYKQLALKMYLPPAKKQQPGWLAWAVARVWRPKKVVWKVEQLTLWEEEECQ